jgi:HrpA-like RNA helicase
VLVFLPGALEIRRATEAMRADRRSEAKDLLILPLIRLAHGRQARPRDPPADRLKVI